MEKMWENSPQQRMLKRKCVLIEKANKEGYILPPAQPWATPLSMPQSWLKAERDLNLKGD